MTDVSRTQPKNFLTLIFKVWKENHMGWLRFRNAEMRRYPYHLKEQS